MTHRNWIAVSGFIWLAVGTLLLYKGLRLISEATETAGSLCFQMQNISGSPQKSGTLFIAAALLVGFLKGRFILSKTVNRVTTRITSLSLPIQFKSVYAPSYWILIGGMMALGMTLRFVPIPVDVRGFVDTAIGAALINGAMLYFRSARGAIKV
jgi:hypothetical protein